MTLQELKALLAEFGGFDGAIIQSIAFHSESSAKSRRIVLVVKAFHSPQAVGGGHWKLVSILASDRIVFGWIESPKNTNLVLNYPVEAMVDGDRLIIDLDPLHQIVGPLGIKVSNFL